MPLLLGTLSILRMPKSNQDNKAKRRSFWLELSVETSIHQFPFELSLNQY